MLTSPECGRPGRSNVGKPDGSGSSHWMVLSAVAVQGYGLKFWPEEFQKLKSAHPHLAMFAEGTET